MFVEGLKSEPVLDRNELKTLNLDENCDEINDDGTVKLLIQPDHINEIQKVIDKKLQTITNYGTLLETFIEIRGQREVYVAKVLCSKSGQEIEINLPTSFGNFKLVAFTQINTEDVHLALIKGKWKKKFRSIYSLFLINYIDLILSYSY